MTALRDNYKNWLLAAALGLTVTLVFLPVTSFEFLRCWDDHTYILDNAAVREFDLARLATDYVLGNYHPLTMLSYAVQYKFFHDSPAGYHAVNLAVHVINCLLVFWLILLITKRRWTAVLTAVLFGLHPLRVEPVAWISGQKDLMSAAFILLMIIAFWYFRVTGRNRFLLASILLYGAGLLTKATVLFSPVILVVLDRFINKPVRPIPWRRFLPYVLIGLCLGTFALKARSSYQGELGEAVLPVLSTFMAAAIRLVFYFGGRIFLPDAGAYYLNMYYLSRSGLPLVSFMTSLAIILIMAAAVAMSRKYTGRVIWGGVFFTAAILPALPAMNLGFSADRFTYLASIGILYALAEYVRWCADRFYHHVRWARYTVTATTIAIVLVMTYGVRVRLPVWRDCLSLTRYFTGTYPDDPSAWMNRGLASADRLDYGAADEYYTRALALNPGYALVYNLRGLTHLHGDTDEVALADFTLAVTIDPQYAEAWYNRGNLQYDQGRLAEAASDYTRAIELDSTHAEAFFNRGNCRARLGDLAAAIDDYTRAVIIDPAHIRARFNRARAYFGTGDLRSAYADLMDLRSAGVPVDPAFVDTLIKLMR